MTDHDPDTVRREFGEAVNTGYVQRHLAQGPQKADVETSKWRYGPMNWGHDPLK